MRFRWFPLVGFLLLIVAVTSERYSSAPAPDPTTREARRAPGASSEDASTPPDPAAAKPAAEASNAFGLDLFARLRETGGNLFFSPVSIEMALGMTSEGAAGATAQQMRAALRLPATNQSFASLASRLNAHDPACEISVANSLWGHNGTMIDPRFIGRVKASFGAGFEQIDFADPTRASDAINHWVAERTHDRIQNLIASDAIRPDGRLVLANAVYFKGAWRDPFEEGMTSDQDFFPAGANRIRAPFMYRAGSYRYAEDAGAQVLELPYGGKDLSMWVILPRRPGGLASLEKTLTRTTLAGWIEKSKAREVEVRVPRFRLETQYSLRAPLEALGIRDAFAPARADFSGIDGRRDLFIGLVAHKAFVEVNEKGTEAAAATGIVMREVSARVGPPPVVFRADHPFLFVIREAGTGAIVFIGRLADPRG